MWFLFKVEEILESYSKKGLKGNGGKSLYFDQGTHFFEKPNR